MHHVIPLCMGGSDDEENIVALTPEEHYVAHQLLVRIYPDNDKLVFAAAMMGKTRPSNKVYGWLKRRFSESMSKVHTGRKNTPETIAKMRASAKTRKTPIRKPHSPETIEKMRLAKLGKKCPQHVIDKIAATKTGMKYGPQSEEHKQKRLASLRATLKEKFSK